MKALSALLVLVFSFSVFADYKSETKAIEKFEVEEYLNEKNYPPRQPGKPRELNKAFYDKLMADPTSVKYFVVLVVAYRLVDLYRKDKAWALALESKFGGQKMTKERWEQVFEYVSNPIMSDSNSNHKKIVANQKATDAQFEKSLALLNSAPAFK